MQFCSRQLAIMALSERTFSHILGPLSKALQPGHFPIFLRAKNPNRDDGTMTGLILQALEPYGAVEVSFMHQSDVPHGANGYALKQQTAEERKVCIEALTDSLEVLGKEWKAFVRRGQTFVTGGFDQKKVVDGVELLSGEAADRSFVFYPCKWLARPDHAFPAVERAIKNAGLTPMTADAFRVLVEDAASLSKIHYYANETDEHMAARIQKLRDRYANETPEQREARIQSIREYYANETDEKMAARIQANFDRFANESAETKEARIQKLRDRYTNESPEQRDARMKSFRDFVAKELPEHRAARVKVLKATIARESEEVRKKRLRNLNMKFKPPQRVKEIRAKYFNSIQNRTKAKIQELRRSRLLRRQNETPAEALIRTQRRDRHLANWKASMAQRTPEQKVANSNNKKAAWVQRRPLQRAKKCLQLIADFHLLSAEQRSYHYKKFGGRQEALGDAFGAHLMDFYDRFPGQLERDAKADADQAAVKVKAKGFSCQKAYDERKRIELYGPNHANMSRAAKLEFTKNKKARPAEGASSSGASSSGAAAAAP